VHSVSDVRHIEIHRAEPLVPNPSPFEVEIDIARLKESKSPGSDKIPAEQTLASETLWSEINTNSVTSVREPTIPTKRSPLLNEVSANFCG
jgi:hypothetical protein